MERTPLRGLLSTVILCIVASSYREFSCIVSDYGNSEARLVFRLVFRIVLIRTSDHELSFSVAHRVASLSESRFRFIVSNALYRES